MKKLFVVLFVLIGQFLVGCANQKVENFGISSSNEGRFDKNQVKIYSDEDSGVELEYPSNWDARKVGLISIFASPRDGDDDTFQENVNFMSQKIDDPEMDLEKYTVIAMNQLKSYISDSVLLSSEKVKFLGNPARQIVYEGTRGNFLLKWKQVWTIVDKKVFIATFTAQKKTFDKYEKIADAIFDSIRTK